MAVAAALILGAALGLTHAVDGIVRGRVQAQNEVDVQSIIDRLTAGDVAAGVLQHISRTEQIIEELLLLAPGAHSPAVG